MPDLAFEIEQEIRTHRLPALGDSLPAKEFVMPHYEGLSIVNLPATTAALLGTSLPGAPPLPAEIWRPFTGGVRCVIRVIVDALGYYRLRRWMEAQPDTLFHRLLRQGARLFPLTSVCPSTTTSALSSLWTGRTPAEHGMMGTKLFLRDRGLQANMIYFTPVSFERRHTLLEEGLEPAEFLPVPGLSELLAASGIETHVLINEQFTGKGLSDIFFRGARAVHGFAAGSAADLWTMLRALLEERAGQRLFISVYYGLLDHLGHLRGASSPVIDAEIDSWSRLMAHEFLDRLSPAAASGTLLMLLADHGQVDAPPDSAVRLNHHPRLRRHLMMSPVGEQRFAYLFAGQGKTALVRDYVREQLDHAFVILDSAQALEAGLFGPGPSAPEASARLGDFILAARQDHFIFSGDEEPHMLGLHGGLNPEEMMVPLIITRLDE